MKIKNFDQLATTPARRDLLTIAEAGLQSIDTAAIMKKLLTTTDLNTTGKIIFIAVGKCAAAAAGVAEAMLGNRITRGVVVDVAECVVGLPQIKTFCGTHPLPSDENMKAAEAIVEALRGLTADDLVIFVVSGGGSTLLFLPEDRRDRNEIKVFNALTAAGADIHEMNVVRKHMSLARGGYLAQYAFPARLISFIFSDVIGDDLSSIASGPTVKDPTTVDDAATVLAKYDVLRVCGIDGIENCGLIETPKDDKYFARATNVLAVSNAFALNAMRAAAESLGYRVEIRSTTLAGEAADVAHMVAESLHAAPTRTVLLWGGETTVAIGAAARGDAVPVGNGGRNLTVAAAGLEYIKEDEEILSLASDGHDHGPYAGAICDVVTKKAAADAGVDLAEYVAAANTYPLFEKINNYLMTGETGSNVSDLVVGVKG